MIFLYYEHQKRLKVSVDEEFCSSYDVIPTCDV